MPNTKRGFHGDSFGESVQRGWPRLENRPTSEDISRGFKLECSYLLDLEKRRSSTTRLPSLRPGTAGFCSLANKVRDVYTKQAAGDEPYRGGEC